jgi:universal bacterial protein YeaZ
MSKILALDSSTDACSAALLLDDRLIDRFVIAPRRHTHLLLPMVEELLAEAGVTLSGLDAIAFGRGPGSFAGIRIATGVAQGLALAARLPVVPVSTLQAMAWAEGEGSAALLTLLDARMEEIYWCAWQWHHGEPRALVDEQVCAPAQLALPDTLMGLEVIGLGSGWRYREQMPAALVGRLGAIEVDRYPRAAAMAQLAQRVLCRGGAVAADLAQPVYLRDQVAWKKKEQQ